jgi:hypothetical protein
MAKLGFLAARHPRHSNALLAGGTPSQSGKARAADQPRRAQH